MTNYELLYALRAAAEAGVEGCDRGLAQRPADLSLVAMRRHYARMAVRYHAKIERLELRYGHT